MDFWAVNRDYPEEEVEKNNHFSRKLKVDYFIDDRGIGGLPDWGQIYRIISEHRTYADIMREAMGHVSEERKRRKKWWWK